MPQCLGYFPLTWPHFLLLPAFWSQGCIRSSSWEGVAHTIVHTVVQQCFPRDGDSREDQALFLCRGLSQRWGREPDVRHSRHWEQQHPRTGITQAWALQGREGRRHSCLQGLGGASQITPRSTFAWLAMFLAHLLKNIYQKKGETAGNCRFNLVCKCKAAECRRGKYNLSLPISFLDIFLKFHTMNLAPCSF